MTTFCHSCGDIVVGERCRKCYGRPVRGLSQFSSPEESSNQPDPWKQKYTAQINGEWRLANVVDGNMIEDNNSEWNCTSCCISFPQQVIPGYQSPSSSTKYCTACQQRKAKGYCETCDDLVLKDSIEFGRKVWHMDCFKCLFCNSDISKLPTVNMQSQPCCQDCLPKDGVLEGYSVNVETEGQPKVEKRLKETHIDTCSQSVRAKPGSPPHPKLTCDSSHSLLGGLNHDSEALWKGNAGISPRSLRAVPVQNRVSKLAQDSQDAAYLAERRPRRISPTIRPSSSSPSLQDRLENLTGKGADEADPCAIKRSCTHNGALNDQTLSPRSLSPNGIPSRHYGLVSPTRHSKSSWKPAHSRSQTITFGDTTKSLTECKQCSEPLKGTTVTLLDGSRYHKDCFKCDMCKNSFEETKYISYSSQYYHLQCVPKFMPHLRLQTEPKSPLRNSDFPISPASSIFASRDRPLPRLGVAEKCPACHLTIPYFEQKPGPNGTKWHEKCRVCNECKKKMDSCALNEIGPDGVMKLYCRQCWDFVKKGRKRLTAPIGSFHFETLRNFGKLGAI